MSSITLEKNQTRDRRLLFQQASFQPRPTCPRVSVGELGAAVRNVKGLLADSVAPSLRGFDLRHSAVARTEQCCGFGASVACR